MYSFEVRKRSASTELTDNGRDGYEISESFWFVIIASNGEIVSTSEMYTRKQSALDTIASMREAGASWPVNDATKDS